MSVLQQCLLFHFSFYKIEKNCLRHIYCQLFINLVAVFQSSALAQVIFFMCIFYFSWFILNCLLSTLTGFNFLLFFLIFWNEFLDSLFWTLLFLIYTFTTVKYLLSLVDLQPTKLVMYINIPFILCIFIFPLGALICIFFNMILLTVFPMLYITSLWFIYFIARNLHLLIPLNYVIHSSASLMSATL